MEWLLKIVGGPMSGAEIALVNGSRVKLGSGDDCDIVIADQSMPTVACELDVSETAVTCIGADGEAHVLDPFVITTSGATSFAVGPAAGAWEELKRPEPPKVEASEEAEDVSHVEATTDGEAHSTRAPQAPEAEAERAATSSKSPYLLLGVLLLLVVAVVILVWFFWPKIVERYPKVEEIRVMCVEKAKTWLSSKQGQQDVAPTTVTTPAPTLADIATTYGLTLSHPTNLSNPSNLLRGNVKRRTERLAIRALALAADPTVKFDLTDDESLCASANELLFVVTDGKLQATSATNRVVTLAGWAPTPSSLERSLRALNADVPGIERLVTSDVQVGGTPPKSKDPSVVITTLPEVPEPRGVAKRAAAVRNYPIAGILTKPYPCVVMRSGLRLIEGAQIENVVIEKIEVDKLTLSDGKTTVVWKP